MRRFLLPIARVLCLTWLSSPAVAGLSFEEILYDKEIVEQSLDEEALARVQQQQREAREAEQQEQQRRLEQQRLRQEEEARRLAARPIGVQLLERRCLSCHGIETIAAKNYGLPGWYLTVARMRYWHQAPLQGDEARLITRHLAQHQPAPSLQQIMEYFIILILPMLAVAFLLYRRIRATQ